MQVDKRPVALLDVDHTLANTDRDRQNIINKTLLHALKLKGIKDVYLFTDMVFSSGAIEERQELIQYLAKQGFTVHGCITPLDYFWQTSTEMLKCFAEKFAKLDICLRDNAPKNTDKIPALLEEFPEINEVITRKIYPDICIAFNDATQSQQTMNDERLMQLNLQSHYCKVMMDITSQLKHSASCKGIMFRQFLAHHPAWVSGCYVFDDRKDHLDAVTECAYDRFPVHTIHGQFTHNIETFTENFDPKIASIILGMRIDSTVTTVTNEIQIYQDAKVFSAFSKNDFELAKQFLFKILSCDESFEAKWKLILERLKSIPKGPFKSYQFSAFDTKLLQALAADKEICRKIGVKLDNESEQNLTILLESFLKPPTNNSSAPELKNLHTSVDSGIKLSRFSSLGSLRPRSASDAQKPKSISTSTESVELDKFSK